jgi:hypothetical protein
MQGHALHATARRSLFADYPLRHSLTILAAFLCLLASLLPAIGSELSSVPAPVVTTNYIIVTNVVLVTNQPSTLNYQLSTNAALPALDWVPPADSFDWIQLKSGEWLKGRLKAMQDRTLEFYSEELGDLSFDWKDIRQLRSPRTLDTLSITGQTFSGPVAITPQQVAVGGTNASVLPRDQLQSLTPGGSKERNLWSGKATLGLTLRSGNTRSVDYNAQMHFQRRPTRASVSITSATSAALMVSRAPMIIASTPNLTSGFPSASISSCPALNTTRIRFRT